MLAGDVLKHGFLVTVSGRELVGGFSHETLLFGHGALLDGLLRSRAAVPLPHKDDDLTDQHTKGAGSQTSQDTEDSGDDDEADDAVKSVGQAVMVVVVHVMTMGTVKLAHVTLKAVMTLKAMVTLSVHPGQETSGEALGVGLSMAVLAVVVVRVGRVIVIESVGIPTVVALRSGGEVEHPGLGRGEQGAHAVEQKLAEALGLATALGPGAAVGSGFFDFGLRHEQFTGVGVVDEGHGYSVEGNWVAVKVENCEANFHEIHRIFREGRNRHLLDGIADGDRVGLCTIGESVLNGGDQGRRRGRENLATVGQEEAVFDGEVERLVRVDENVSAHYESMHMMV